MNRRTNSKTNLRTALREFERTFILKTLKACKNDKHKTAEVMGIGFSSLYRKLRQFGLLSK